MDAAKPGTVAYALRAAQVPPAVARGYQDATGIVRLRAWQRDVLEGPDGVADARRGVAPADDLVADAGDVASSSSRSSPGSEMMASSRGGSADGDGASEPRFRRSGALARTPIVFSVYTASPAHELV